MTNIRCACFLVSLLIRIMNFTVWSLAVWLYLVKNIYIQAASLWKQVLYSWHQWKYFSLFCSCMCTGSYRCLRWLVGLGTSLWCIWSCWSGRLSCPETSPGGTEETFLLKTLITTFYLQSNVGMNPDQIKSKVCTPLHLLPQLKRDWSCCPVWILIRMIISHKHPVGANLS